MTLGLVNSQGQQWRLNRMALSKIMLNSTTVSNSIPIMDDVIDDFLKRIVQVKDEKNAVANLETELFNWALECKQNS